MDLKRDGNFLSLDHSSNALNCCESVIHEHNNNSIFVSESEIGNIEVDANRPFQMLNLMQPDGSRGCMLLPHSIVWVTARFLPIEAGHFRQTEAISFVPSGMSQLSQHGRQVVQSSFFKMIELSGTAIISDSE